MGGEWRGLWFQAEAKGYYLLTAYSLQLTVDIKDIYD
jgi:hypothetical protein